LSKYFNIYISLTLTGYIVKYMQYSRYILDEQDRQQDELDGLQDEHIGCRTSI